MDRTSLGFPLNISRFGQVNTLTGNDNIRAKVLQVLLTSPGERVNLPEFGCGLRDLVFDPNNEILAATTEFTVNKALQAWLGDEIIVESVNVFNAATSARAGEAELQVEVIYVRIDQRQRGKVKIAF